MLRGSLQRPPREACSSRRQQSQQRLHCRPCSGPRADWRIRVSVVKEADTQTPSAAGTDPNQRVREGDFEAPLVRAQASKRDAEQGKLAEQLPPLDPKQTQDVLVVGCGPAGMYLAAQLAQRGLKVGLIGPDTPFVNNYGVWVDEFRDLGLEGTLEVTFPDALCYFGEGQEKRVGRAYARVSRRLLRAHLAELCKTKGVTYLPAEVTSTAVSPDQTTVQVTCSNGALCSSRLVTLASGQAAGRLLQYEPGAPGVAAQTAYGIEAEVEGYDAAYDPGAMLFMDFRRHHTGVWDARKLTAGNHPNAADNLWGSGQEVPSFLYAMPLGGNRVFLEETCLVAKPALPFRVLKRRLERRMAAMGLKSTKVHEEEWSYIPVGGPLPKGDQYLTAFGAAANLVHPATGFSVSRSMREAPAVADAAAAALAAGGDVHATGAAVWQQLWPQEKRRQASFQVFGMELLTQLDLGATNDFFRTFFALPPFYWRGFLGSSLSSAQLLAFAFLVFWLAPVNIKLKLVSHLTQDPSGTYLIRHYLGDASSSTDSDTGSSNGTSSAATATGSTP